MKIYTVLSIDDFCGSVCSEPYATLELAFERAKQLAAEFCGGRFVMPKSVGDIDPEVIRMNNDYEYAEYLICDGESGNMYISIVEQDLLTSLPSQNEDHYDASAKHLAASMCEAEDERILAELDTLASMPTLAEVDDPAHWSLPAGWGKDLGWDKNHKPIYMQAFYNDPSCIKPISELTQNEKEALTIARISKRPNYSFTFGSTTWNQKSALEELSHYYKTWSSYDIVDHEMEQLQGIFDAHISELQGA